MNDNTIHGGPVKFDPGQQGEASRPPGLLEQIVEYVRAHPGSTQRELGVIYSPKDLRRIGRRVGEAARAQLIRVGAPKKCSISGRRAVTYWPIEEAAQ